MADAAQPVMLSPNALMIFRSLGQQPELVCPCPMMRISPAAIFAGLVLVGLALAALIATLVSVSVYFIRKSAR